MADFVSVKLTSSGRAQTFLLPELSVDATAPADAPPQTAIEPDVPLRPGDPVVVETGQGSAIGQVIPTIPVVADRRRPAEDSPRRVVRRAARDDVATRLRQEHREREARQFCGLKIRELGLEMKLTKVEQAFDGSRMVFYYTSEERVDFRELVRELASHLRTRIEMRQIGVRDEAKMLGGYGPCGQPLCCSTWLTSFEPVTIKMAKQQNLSLNPSRLSGMCGRLKCCLRYEIPNGKGVKHGGCAENGGCGNPTGPGAGGCACGPASGKHEGKGGCEGECGCRA